MRREDLAMGYHEQVDEVAQDYYQSAGISPAMVAEFRLGWVHDPLLAQHEGVRNTPVFPFWTVRERCVQLRFDAIRQDMIGNHTGIIFGHNFPFPMPEHHLYNVRHTLPGLRTSQVILTSDIRSCIIGRSIGWRTVAAPGYENFYEPWLHLFDDAHVVLVWNSTEDALVEGLSNKFKHRGIEVLPMRLPGDETLASFIGPDVPHGIDIIDIITSSRLEAP